MGAPGALWNPSPPGFPGLALLGILSQVWRTRGPETLLNDYIRARSYVDRSLAVRTPVRPADWLAPPDRAARTGTGSPAASTTVPGEISVPTLILGGC